MYDERESFDSGKEFRTLLDEDIMRSSYHDDFEASTNTSISLN